MKKFIVLALVSFVFVGCGDNSNYSYLDSDYSDNSFIESEITTNNIKEAGPKIDEIIESEKFALISEDKLIELMGQPSDIEDWKFTTSNGTFPTKTYSYDSDYHYEFLVIDGKVVRMNCYSLKYWTGKGENIKYINQNDIPLMFGVSKKVGSSTNTGYAVRWSNLTGNIKDVWVIDVDDTSKTFSGIKITFDELYLD